MVAFFRDWIFYYIYLISGGIFGQQQSIQYILLHKMEVHDNALLHVLEVLMKFPLAQYMFLRILHILLLDVVMLGFNHTPVPFQTFSPKITHSTLKWNPQMKDGDREKVLIWQPERDRVLWLREKGEERQSRRGGCVVPWEESGTEGVTGGN